MRRALHGAVAALAALSLILAGAGAASAATVMADSFVFTTAPTFTNSTSVAVSWPSSYGNPVDRQWNWRCASVSPSVVETSQASRVASLVTSGSNYVSSTTFTCASGQFVSFVALYLVANNGTSNVKYQSSCQSNFYCAQWSTDYFVANGSSCSGTTNTGGSTGSTTLTDAQLVAVARGAGFADAAPQYQSRGLTWAVAVALAESAGRVDALNTSNSNGSVDRGLWQINSVHSQYNATKLLTDAAYNAAAAWQISGGGTTWKPWSTFSYSLSAYNFYNRAAAAVAGTGYTGVIPCAGDTTGLPPAAPDGTDGSWSGVGDTPATPTSAGSCAPSGWQLLNPLAYVKGMFCVLQLAFVPTSATSTAWDNFRQSVSQKPPYSLVVGASNFVNGTLAGVRGGSSITPYAQTPGTVAGVQLQGGISGFLTDCSTDAFGNQGATDENGNVAGAACDEGVLTPYAQLMRNVMRVGIWVGFLFLLWRRTNAALGARTESESDNGN